jgi:hypothetical protein
MIDYISWFDLQNKYNEKNELKNSKPSLNVRKHGFLLEFKI